MKQWSASKYKANKVKRLADVVPEWVTNPETGEQFFLRRVGAMAHMIAGHMPHDLTNTAIEGWKEAGLEVEGEAKTSTPKAIDESQRDLALMGKVVAQSCVIPKLVNNPTKDDELDPADLDDKDVLFIFRYATGQVNAQGVSLIGGQVMGMADLKSLRKTTGRRSRIKPDGEKLQQAS